MAEADLDILIRSIGKKQHKSLMDAAKKRHARLMGLAGQGQEQGGKGSFQANRKDNARNGKRRGKAVAGHGGECSR